MTAENFGNFDNVLPLNPEDETLSGEVLILNIPTKAKLQQSYMSFVKGGGLFVATKKEHSLDENVYLLVKLMDEPEKFTVSGKIVWLTPAGAQGGLPAGIGVQFINEDSDTLRKKIETYLAGSKNNRRTDTM